MDNLFAGNVPILYFIAVISILLLEKLEINQKILIVYIFSYIIKIYNVLDFKILLLILNIDLFIYLEYLTEDKVKTEILSNYIYKFIDYLYKMFFEYGFAYFILALFTSTTYFKNCYSTTCNNIILLNYNISLYSNIFCNMISAILIVITINFLSSENYVTNTFTEMKKKLDEVTSWTSLELSDDELLKFYMLSYIEDKSYFERENSYSFFSIEFIRYKLSRSIQGINIKNILRANFWEKCKSCAIHIVNKLKKIRNIKRYIRGYATIEMQLIRTIGVKKGYGKVLYRKIYEIIYSKIFFGSYRRYCNVNKYRVNCSYKEYLMYCYINLADIKINNKKYKNMLEVWKNKKLKDISKEQFFISILGLSYRRINEDILYNYSSVIQIFDINQKKLKKYINNC